MHNLMEQYEKMIIGVDEPFTFHCTQCGKCCIDREDILLNGRDIYRAAKKFNMSPEQYVVDYCEMYIGHDSKVPIVRLVPKNGSRLCPMLKNRKCMIHECKPTVCAMFPIGRMTKMNQTTKEKEFNYIFVDPECGDKAELHTAREWLGQFGIPVEDVFYIRWTEMIGKAAEFARKVVPQFSENTMTYIWNMFLAMFYLEYDTKREFMPQFEENMRVLEEMLGKLNEVCPY